MAGLKPFEHFATNAIHVGQDAEKWNSRAVIPPISMATTFKQDSPELNVDGINCDDIDYEEISSVEPDAVIKKLYLACEPQGYDYSRSGNPTRECFEQCIASLDGAKYGLAFSSGLGATTTIMMMLKSGDHVIVMDDVYGGTNRLFSKVVKNHNIEFSFVDCRDLGLLEKSIRPGQTKLLWVETPTNPTMKIVDIEGACKIAHKHKDIIVVTDNTFMSPYFQRPLMWGSDVTFHSVTKYINGHSDACLGMVCTSNDDIYNKLKYLQNAAGCVPSPFDCFLANRGAKTLHVRMKQHQENAMAIAKYLEASPRVKRVIYPGLPSHPQHELVKKQCTGFSGMLSFDMLGNIQNSRTFLSSLKIFTLAESLGGFESLAELPAVMTHASVDPEDREKLGITDTLIRFSVGLENAEDLIADVDQALKKAIPDSDVEKLK